MFGTVLQLKRIFLLEDDMSLRRGIAMALESPEVSVIQAGCIGEAESALGAGEQFDLMILDVNLPDGSGMEFCKKIRETAETPVLFLTANDTEQDMLEGFGAGCDDYISKPFSIEVLRKKVQAVLKRTGGGKRRPRKCQTAKADVRFVYFQILRGKDTDFIL